ncbi:hypothetical protein BC939DRAFT_209116 [Gamsiella multidivaricata]|uniref:uncharacterized protein n=1 Tax=Gamsiella multidivaricata TaxID=101098 RepID=UPI00221F452C|nr:uncharacterized protein BC939DRAFT_209116 [Gamsiella multidivaricata]KAI7821413.1 hypothetical protein BC939DRAFT_209116 [Gamsiella multidivaricata]
MEPCPFCTISPKSEKSWSYSLARHLSFMDDTAELRHPSISSDTVQNWLGFTPKEFNILSMIERAQLKKRHYLERFKVYFKVSWSDFKKQQVVHIIAIEQAHLPELENLNHASI